MIEIRYKIKYNQINVTIGIGVFALVFIYLGCLMWKKEKITLPHNYHYDKVSLSDKKVFCKISGWGVIFIGIGLLMTAIIIGITDSALSFIAFTLGVAEDFYDFLIWKELTNKPIKEARLIGNIMGKYPVSKSDWWYAKRINDFIAEGKIKVAEDSEIRYARLICLG